MNKVSFHISFFVLIAFILASFFSAKKAGYQLYSRSKKINLDAVVQSTDTNRVLIFGEEHNDSVAHYLQLRLLQDLFKVHGVNLVLSLEMFQQEDQYIMNEYLSGLIKEKFFLDDANAWSNYASDYRSLVEFAKDKKLKVICSNAPFRYANLVSVYGMDSLMNVSNYGKQFLPPLPFTEASPVYRKKIEDLMGGMATNDSTGYDLLKGQALWNASMAYFINQQIVLDSNSVVFHINGRLHSDGHLGLPEKLVQYNSALENRIGVITCRQFENKPSKSEIKELDSEGDFVVVTFN